MSMKLTRSPALHASTYTHSSRTPTKQSSALVNSGKQSLRSDVLSPFLRVDPWDTQCAVEGVKFLVSAPARVSNIHESSATAACRLRTRCVHVRKGGCHARMEARARKCAYVTTDVEIRTHYARPGT
jgi:hypothetical protein